MINLTNNNTAGSNINSPHNMAQQDGSLGSNMINQGKIQQIITDS
jgi:hypothetical protein